MQEGAEILSGVWGFAFPCCPDGFCLERPQRWKFPQPSADLLPSGSGEISLRRHQKLVSAENPDSVAITHPLGCVTLLRNACGGAQGDAFTWGGPCEHRLGHPVWTTARKKRTFGFLPLYVSCAKFGVGVGLAGGMFSVRCLWLLTREIFPFVQMLQKRLAAPGPQRAPRSAALGLRTTAAGG